MLILMLAMKKSSAEVKARFLSMANEAKFEALGAADAQINVVVSAGVTLRSSIDAAATVSDVDAAFSAYHDTIVDQLRVTLDSEAEAVTTIDSSINSSTGAKATLETALSAPASTGQVVDAYVTFYEAVKTSVDSSLSALSSAEAETAAEILILANMQV